MTDQPRSASPDDDLPEQLRIRREKRDRLLAAGVEVYPVSVGRTHDLASVRRSWGHLEAGEETTDVVTVSGRVVFIRNTGKLCFATLQDGFTAHDSGERLQVMLSLAEVGEQRLADWKADVDLGDFVAVTGRVICSRRGELSVMASDWKLAAKALRPMPNLHSEMSDEARVRQRHADLVVRPSARDMVRTRATITKTLRSSLDRLGYLEVETPVLQLLHGGAAARPFGTHLNAFDQDMTLRIALELYLKRAMVGGVDRVYEIGRVFRNEGIDSSHAPEFTMLEAYQSWGDQYSIAEMTKQLILDVADALGSRTVTVGEREIDLGGEWRWLGVHEGLSEKVGEEITLDTSREELLALAAKHSIELDPALSEGKLVMELFEELVEDDLQQPTFVHDYPAIAQPLARPKTEEPRLVEAWDLIIGGMERGTGFSELIDPVIQREVLTAQSLAAAAGDLEAMQLDEEFLAALEFGAPPMGGMGLGLDRLVMLFTGSGVRETILFPLLKPQG